MAEAARKIDELDDDFIKCRTLGHAWDPKPRSTRLSRRKGGMYFQWDLKCLRCGSEKTEAVWAFGGDVDKRTYRYTEGYSVKGSKSRVTRTDARRVLVKRYIGRRGR